MVRMAVLYELLAGRGTRAAPRRDRAGRGSRHDRLLAPRRRRPPTCWSAAPTCSTRARASTRRATCSCAAARSPRSARRRRSTAPPRRRARRRRRAATAARLRRPARAPARARARSTRRTSRRAPARPPPAASSPWSRCPTPTRRSTPRPSCARCASAAAREARVPGRLPGLRSRAACGASELTEMAELRDAGALGFTDDGKPVADAGAAAQGAAVPAAVRRRARAARGGPVAVGGGVMHEGEVSARARPRRHPVDLASRRWSPATPRSPATRTRASTSSTSRACESVEAVAAAKARGVRGHRRGCPHHLMLTDEDVPRRSTRA